MPEFFVLTPTHNRSSLLEKAIESVCNQSYEDWQLFIMDDGSKDETPQLLANYANDPRIHSWRFETNRGVNPARNYLLDRILESGRPGFIVILDDDDTLEKDALANLAEAVRANPSEKWFIANCVLPSGDRVSQIKGPYRPLCYVKDHKLGNQLSGDVSHVFHTSIVGENRFIDSFPNAEEWWFYAGLATQARMFALDFHAKTVEYLEDGLTISQPNKEHGAEIYSLKLERFDAFLSRSQRASLEARLGRHLYSKGERGAGLAQLAKAFSHWPFEYRIYAYTLEIPLRPLWRWLLPRRTNIQR